MNWKLAFADRNCVQKGCYKVVLRLILIDQCVFVSYCLKGKLKTHGLLWEFPWFVVKFPGPVKFMQKY